MRNKGTLTNIDNSDPANYPDGRIKNNTGAGNGTPVNEFVYGDLHEAKDKLMRLYGIAYNGLPDNETNGYQLIDAMIALASKNDFLLNLTDISGVISVPLKLGKLKDNEAFITKATFDKGAQTSIKGSDGVTKTVTFIGSFKTNEYVRMVNTSSSVILVRLVDSFNVDAVVNELLYLKKATQTQENAGTSELVATTPLTNKTVFTSRVQEATYLATAVRNGTYPKEHFAIVENIGVSATRNVGGFSGFDSGGGSIGSTYPVFGDVTTATVLGTSGGGSRIRVDLSNTMDSANYFVRVHLKSESTSPENDRGLFTPTTRNYTTTSFEFQVQEADGLAQNLKITFEVVQL